MLPCIAIRSRYRAEEQDRAGAVSCFVIPPQPGESQHCSLPIPHPDTETHKRKACKYEAYKYIGMGPVTDFDNRLTVD